MRTSSVVLTLLLLATAAVVTQTCGPASRGPMAGDYRGKDGVAQMFQRQMQMLDSPPEIDTHDILANDNHAIVLNKVRGTRGGKTLEQQQVVVLHIKGGKIAEVWLQFSDQQGMDEMASS